MKTGFIYELAKVLIEALRHLNLVELFKLIGAKLNPQKNDLEKVKTFERTATDIFIVLKWAFVTVLWAFAVTSFWTTLLVWYLLLMNLFTYFYYHIWCDEALNTENHAKDRVRRRFIHLMLAVAFSVFCFGFLYQIPYSNEINWGTKTPSLSYSLMFSFSTALAGNYEEIKPKTDFANMVCAVELLITFLFVTIILSRSIPQTNSTT